LRARPAALTAGAEPAAESTSHRAIADSRFLNRSPRNHTRMNTQLSPSKPPDKIRVTCTQCRIPFREKVKNVREGVQVQCPNCSRLMTFSADSADSGIQRAMTDARRIKNALLLTAGR